MENLAILETTEICKINWWCLLPLSLAFIFALIANASLSMCKKLLGVISLGLAIVCTFFGFKALTKGIPTGIYKHTVYVGDVQTAIEINEKYTVLSKDGCIWEITDIDFAEKFLDTETNK